MLINIIFGRTIFKIFLDKDFIIEILLSIS
jgi:hypothetical protein